MIKIILAAALLAGPSFAERTGTARPKLATPPPMEECDASDLGFVTGKPFSETLKERAREASGSRTVRVIRPGEAVTMDYGLTRLNLELDAKGIVINARCG